VSKVLVEGFSVSLEIFFLEIPVIKKGFNKKFINFKKCSFSAFSIIISRFARLELVLVSSSNKSLTVLSFEKQFSIYVLPVIIVADIVLHNSGFVKQMNM
jgi:hypothetical protein